MKDVIIIGAGIAGLTAGFELGKNNLDFHILDTSNRAGGVIETIKTGDYLIECGPHAFSSLSHETLELIKELNLEDDLIQASPDARKRYVHNNGHLYPVPSNPKEFFKTEIISKEAKFTLFEEFFIPKDENDESVEEFISRRFGREVLKNIVQPYLNGVFAGDVKTLSAKAVFPKLKNLEAKHKSVLLGFILSRGLKPSFKRITLHSFKEGLEQLPKELYEKLKTRITLNSSNIEITRAKDFFMVSFKLNNKTINYTTNSILFAIPAYKVLDYSHLFPSERVTEILHTEYAPIASVSQSVDKKKINTELDGFGFLCVKEPQRKLLGTIWTSSVFPDRVPKDKVLLTSYIGGSLYKKITTHTEEEIKNIVTKEVCEILKIDNQSFLETINIKLYTHAIPQYNLGHTSRVKHIEEFMDKNYGLFVTGNYLYGISINDTVKTSQKIAERIKTFLRNTDTKKEELAAT